MASEKIPEWFNPEHPPTKPVVPDPPEKMVSKIVEKALWLDSGASLQDLVDQARLAKVPLTDVYSDENAEQYPWTYDVKSTVPNEFYEAQLESHLKRKESDEAAMAEYRKSLRQWNKWKKQYDAERAAQVEERERAELARLQAKYDS